MKLINSVKYDGVNNTLRNLFSFFKRITYGQSITALLRVKIPVHPELNDNLNLDGLEIKKINNIKADNLLNLNSSRFDKWLKSGSHLYVAKINGIIVAYTVVHLNKYVIGGVGTVNLKEKESIWIGPTFVHKLFRSQGINKKLINYTMQQYSSRKKFAFTSANVNNINSIRSFIRNGFELKDVFICTYRLGKQNLVRLVGDE